MCHCRVLVTAQSWLLLLLLMMMMALVMLCLHLDVSLPHLQEVACPLAFSTMGTTAYTIHVTQVGLFQVKGDPRPTEVVQLSAAHLNGRLPLLPKDPPKGKGTRLQARSSCVAEVKGVPLPSAAAQASARMLPALRSSSSVDGSSNGGGGHGGIGLRAASFAAVAFSSLRRTSSPLHPPPSSRGPSGTSNAGDVTTAAGSAEAAGRRPVLVPGLSSSLRTRDSASSQSGLSALGPSRTHSLPAWLGGAAGGSGGMSRPSLKELSQPPMMTAAEGDEDDMV
jgi:hypothetical protein